MSKAYSQLVSLEDDLVYFLDCQLATVEEMETRKRPPAGRLRRHRELARKMIERARAHGIDLSNESRVIAFQKKERERGAHVCVTPPQGIAERRVKPAIRIEKIGPEQARRYLETMGPPSYPVKPAVVSMLADRMRSGAWSTKGEPIVETEEGKMLSGRRRMLAVIEAGVEVDFVVQTWIASTGSSGPVSIETEEVRPEQYLETMSKSVTAEEAARRYMPPVVIDELGKFRFRENPLITAMLKFGARRGDPKYPPFTSELRQMIDSKKGNAIVKWISRPENQGMMGVDEVLRHGGWTQEDLECFAMLIGYSLEGAAELSFFSNAMWERAWALANNP